MLYQHIKIRLQIEKITLKIAETMLPLTTCLIASMPRILCDNSPDWKRRKNFAGNDKILPQSAASVAMSI